MSFVAALATIGTTIAEGAAIAGSSLAAGAGAVGSGLAAGAGAIGSGLGSLGAGLGAEAGAAGAAGLGAEAGGIGALGAAGTEAITPAFASGIGAAAPAGFAPAAGMGEAMAAAPAAITPAGLTNVAGSAATPFFETMGGKALMGAGIGGLGGAITNPNDPMKGALIGAGTGALGGAATSGLQGLAGSSGIAGDIGKFAVEHPYITAGAVGIPASMALNSMTSGSPTAPKMQYPNIDPNKFRYSQPQWSVYKPSYAAGGLTDLDGFASQAQNVEQGMPAQMQGGIGTLQVPNPKEVADPTGYTGESAQAMAQGGIANLGGYTNGGLLQGDGDGVSDDIHGTIRDKAPVRLASGEFIVPARTVSELGNGDTNAGAKRLDQMVKNINAGRSKTLKGKDYAKDTKAYKHLPA